MWPPPSQGHTNDLKGLWPSQNAVFGHSTVQLGFIAHHVPGALRPSLAKCFPSHIFQPPTRGASPYLGPHTFGWMTSLPGDRPPHPAPTPQAFPDHTSRVVLPGWTCRASGSELARCLSDPLPFLFASHSRQMGQRLSAARFTTW